MTDTDRRPRLLAVEDNDDTRVLLNYLLAPIYHVHLAASVDDALRSVRSHRFDVLIIDINLGERRTGLDALAAIRETPHHASVPALALTAYALPGDEERYLDAGFDAYLSKPFTRRQLLSATAELVSSPTGAGKRDVSSSKSTSTPSGD